MYQHKTSWRVVRFGATLVGALCMLGMLLVTPRALALEVETLQDNGPAANRVDLVILGDGYRVGDQAQLTQDALNMLDAFWGHGVFAAYRSFFNVRLIHVISNENGADNGSFGASRDTALGANYGCFGIDRLLCIDTGAVLSVAASNAPDYDQLLVVVNDPKYGGSGGQIATTSISPSAPDICVHETGHSLMQLADEYSDPYPGFPECGSDCPEANVTKFTDFASIKWNSWIDAGTPLPTPDTPPFFDTIGAFEGARYFSTGIYRPAHDCIMRTLDREFCSVCREQVNLTAYKYASPIDAKSPAGDVLMTPTDNVQFSVAGPRPSPNTTLVHWLIDGVEVVVGPANEQTFAASQFGPGSHTLEARVHDDTSFVRRDDDDLLTESAFWQVSVEAVPPVAQCQDYIADGCGPISVSVDNGSYDPMGQPLTCIASPPGPYSLGDTTVTLTCTTSDGRSDSCVAHVILTDSVPPVFTFVPPALTIPVCTGVNLGQATATDNCGGPVAISNDAPAKFPLGTTTVTWTARDPSNNTKTATQLVTAILGDDPSCCPAGTKIILGNNNSNVLVGTTGRDCILLRGGNDVVNGFGGGDYISGGSGNDTISAGLGNDYVNGGAGTDICATAPGTDTVLSCEVQ